MVGIERRREDVLNVGLRCENNGEVPNELDATQK